MVQFSSVDTRIYFKIILQNVIKLWRFWIRIINFKNSFFYRWVYGIFFLSLWQYQNKSRWKIKVSVYHSLISRYGRVEMWCTLRWAQTSFVTLHSLRHYFHSSQNALLDGVAESRDHSDENKTHLSIYSYLIVHRLAMINNKTPSRHTSILRCCFVIYLSVNTGFRSYNSFVTSRANAPSASLGAHSHFNYFIAFRCKYFTKL